MSKQQRPAAGDDGPKLEKAEINSPRSSKQNTDLQFHRLASWVQVMEGSEFEDLRDNIKARGLRDPITMYEGSILDGRNRYRALLAAGVKITPEMFVEFDPAKDGDPLEFVISRTKRRNWNTSQKASAAAELANLGKGRPSVNAQNCAITQDEAADRLNVSRRTVQSAVVVRDHGEPELKAALAQGRIAAKQAEDAAKLSPRLQREVAKAAVTGDLKVVRKIVKYERRQQKIDALTDQLRDLPDQKFAVIYADPPWRFEPYSADTSMLADDHYATSDLDTIKALLGPSEPGSKIVARHAVLFLWATVPMLTQALEVMAHWGFAYKTHFAWVKDQDGTGYWNRNRHELLLLGTRGEIPAPAPGTQWPSAIEAPRGRHSEKPEVFRKMIEEHFPTLPKAELYARGKPPKGWVFWGAEAVVDEAAE
jgi:N6-adenosine-specific RNA methylase IME4